MLKMQIKSWVDKQIIDVEQEQKNHTSIHRMDRHRYFAV